MCLIIEICSTLFSVGAIFFYRPRLQRSTLLPISSPSWTSAGAATIAYCSRFSRKRLTHLNVIRFCVSRFWPNLPKPHCRQMDNAGERGEGGRWVRAKHCRARFMLVFVWAILSPIRINQLSSPDRFCVFGYGDDGDALAALPNVKITTTTKHGTAMMYPSATTSPPLPCTSGTH